MVETRSDPKKQNVLDAAERLLREGKAAFSMRELAAEAGVSFATPFNQFGNKAGIMQALSSRRIEAMVQGFSQARGTGDASDRIILAMKIATEVMLEEPVVNKGVMSWIGAVTPTPGHVLAHSSELWALALGEGDGINADVRAFALEHLPVHFALGFRGVLSFWTSGEISDQALTIKAQQMAITILMGFAPVSPIIR